MISTTKLCSLEEQCDKGSVVEIIQALDDKS